MSFPANQLDRLHRQGREACLEESDPANQPEESHNRSATEWAVLDYRVENNENASRMSLRDEFSQFSLGTR